MPNTRGRVRQPRPGGCKSFWRRYGRKDTETGSGGRMIQTFEQSAQDYLAKLKTRKRKPVKATTLATFSSAVKLALQMPGFGSLTLESIDSEHLRLLAESIGEKSPQTINLTVRVVKSV